MIYKVNYDVFIFNLLVYGVNIFGNDMVMNSCIIVFGVCKLWI